MSVWRATVGLMLLASPACSLEGGGTETSSTGGAASGGAGGISTGVFSGGSGGEGTAASGGAASSGSTSASSTGTGPPPFSVEVACGTAVCEDATPVCCVSMTGALCAPYMGSLSCTEAGATSMFCDDASDCLAGQVCCVNAPNLAYACAYAPCATHESCTPGGMCGQAGYSCVEDAAQASGAKCVMN